MSIATKTTRPVEIESNHTATAVRHRDWHWAVCALAAAVTLGVASFLPLWTMTLHAPQYPAGLQLKAYGTRMEGDLSEINELNHYIGIKAIEPDGVTELRLFPFVMSLLVVSVVAGAVLVRNWRLRALLALAVWSIPVTMLIDLQWWLYNFGHDLSPDAPFRIDEFTPRVIGSTKVMNFDSDAMVAPGFWLMVAAGVVITVGPWVIRFLWESWNNTGDEPTK